MFRVTGRVVRTDNKSGSKANAQTGEVRDWAFDVVKVLVCEQAIVEVARFSDSMVPLPEVGEDVDYAVEIGVRGGRLSVNLDKHWADAEPKPLPQARRRSA